MHFLDVSNRPRIEQQLAVIKWSSKLNIHVLLTSNANLIEHRFTKLTCRHCPSGKHTQTNINLKMSQCNQTCSVRSDDDLHTKMNSSFTQSELSAMGLCHPTFSHCFLNCKFQQQGTIPLMVGIPHVCPTKP